MATFDELIKQKLRLIDTAENELLLSTANAQRQLWSNISDDFNRLQVDANGNIRLTENNLKIAAEIVDKLKNGLAATEFRDAMVRFLGNFDQSANLNQEIARTFRANYTLNSSQRELINQSKAIAIDLLTNEGYKSRIDQTFRIPLNAALQSGANLNNTIKSMREIVQGGPDSDGRLMANVKTYAATTFSSADRALSNQINIDLGIQWFRYVGGEIDTTRPFCEERNGKFFHRKEIEKWGMGENAGGLDDLTDGTWSGQVAGTDENTIFVFAGGWNCRHSIIPVSENRVPDEVKQRAKDAGYI